PVFAGAPTRPRSPYPTCRRRPRPPFSLKAAPLPGRCPLYRSVRLCYDFDPMEGIPGMFRHIGGFAARRPLMVCAAWVLLGITLALVAPSWDKRAQDDDIRFLPDRCPSVRGYKLLEQAFPKDVFASRVIFAVERPGAKLTDADLHLVDDIVAGLKK